MEPHWSNVQLNELQLQVVCSTPLSCRHLFCLILAPLIFGPQGMGGSQEVDFEKEAARMLAKTKELHELSNIVTSGQ